MKPFAQSQVEIRRGHEKIHVDVPQHEVLVLRVVHRPEHVSVLGPAKRKLQMDESIGAEWARLQRKYRIPNGADPVARAFPLGPAMLEEFGFGGGETAAPQQEGAGVIDHEELREQEAERARLAAEAEAAAQPEGDKKPAGKK